MEVWLLLPATIQEAMGLWIAAALTPAPPFECGGIIRFDADVDCALDRMPFAHVPPYIVSPSLWKRSCR